jgi:hypothetical protein
MRHSAFVTAAESISVHLSQIARDSRTTVLVAVVDVWPPVIFKVPARAIHAIVKAPALNFVKLPWYRIPAAAVLTVAGGEWRGGSAICRGRDQTGGSQAKYKCGHCKTTEKHRTFSFCEWLLASYVLKAVPGYGHKKRAWLLRESGAAMPWFLA